MTTGRRVAICGSISSYNAESMPGGTRNPWMLTIVALVASGDFI